VNALEAAAVTRRRTLEARRSLGGEERARLSAALVSRFRERWRDRAGGRSWSGARVGLYRALPDEPDLGALEMELSAAGARLFFPRIVDRLAGRMELAESPAGERNGWEAGLFGVAQPSASASVVDPGELAVVFVPGVAFGRRGERIGMGAGYYDRYLARATGALRVALAFDFQLHDRIEQGAWDQPLHWILTEKREASTPGLDEWLRRDG
jgi:5-formyltetrahydrofolate cyclo-ligase